MRGKSYLTISIDFELFWGVRDLLTISQYGDNILGGRRAIPMILDLFRLNKLQATWAIVGFVTFFSRQQMIQYIPSELPKYVDEKYDAYKHLRNIGENENEDPFHYGYSLVRQIQDTPLMEIGSHTFSHFYCLEKRLNFGAFRSDLTSSVGALQRLGINPTSIVFCRNQYDEAHLKEAELAGFKNYRGNQEASMYKPTSRDSDSLLLKGCRFLDSYAKITADPSAPLLVDVAGINNIRASRFLRPHIPALSILENLKLKRILDEMTIAAIMGEAYHLWWHPHNFGKNTNKNIETLVKIIEHFNYLSATYGMESKSMDQASSCTNQNSNID